MPKVKITEIDNTGNLQLNPITNVVYIPGKASAKMSAPVLCSTVNDLAKLKESQGLVLDLSYKLAYRCLQLGLQVLYQGFVGDSSETSWTEGSYSAPIIEDSETHIKHVTISGEEFTYDEDNNKLITVKQYGSPKANLEFAVEDGKCIINDTTNIFIGIPENPDTHAAQYQTVLFDYVNNKVGYNWLGVAGGGITISESDWDALSDKALYDIRFLTSGAYPQGYSDMIKCATKRGDCVALLDHSSSLKNVASIRAVFEGILDSDVSPKLLKKYAAAFTPWWKANVTGEFGFGSELLPPSFAYLFAYARSIQTNPDWFAVAGTFRGNIPELASVEKEYTTAEVEMLQGRAANAEVELDGIGDNIGIAINPIAWIRGYGYLIWGNRTLVENTDLDENGTGDLKATSFLNVRMLCSDIVKTLYAAARKYTFEQNSNTLWLNFKHQIQPLLDRMVSGNGINSYTFEQLPTTAKARLKARITITPIEGVEDFELELYLEDSLEVIE